ncbi:hypothetical protein predicted by Glimmer/Critica [Acetobacter ghanensis]|uniref:Uncharacterized protein n=1 Tax=Acetobacter ghanensis TaxID=431306 RepID=A0A0U5FU15_9PROT|nr:hypothetical protein predicted by Glimmer/Critica [Acetobacter ghanensis]
MYSGTVYGLAPNKATGICSVSFHASKAFLVSYSAVFSMHINGFRRGSLFCMIWYRQWRRLPLSRAYPGSGRILFNLTPAGTVDVQVFHQQ